MTSTKCSLISVGNSWSTPLILWRQVFGQSQEMVVFITSLNMGFYSVRFLGEYECERYYRYNQTLLFDGQKRKFWKKSRNSSDSPGLLYSFASFHT